MSTARLRIYAMAAAVMLCGFAAFGQAHRAVTDSSISEPDRDLARLHAKHGNAWVEAGLGK